MKIALLLTFYMLFSIPNPQMLNLSRTTAVTIFTYLVVGWAMISAYGTYDYKGYQLSDNQKTDTKEWLKTEPSVSFSPRQRKSLNFSAILSVTARLTYTSPAPSARLSCDCQSQRVNTRYDAPNAETDLTWEYKNTAVGFTPFAVIPAWSFTPKGSNARQRCCYYYMP